jgi:Mrp family chromosome partitioning ATPase
MTTFINALRDIRTAIGRRTPADGIPVIAVIGAGTAVDRSIATLNFALAAARDDARVLMIDADRQAHKLSNKLNRLGKSEPSRLGWLSIGSKASRATVTANGISILPAVKAGEARAADAIRKSIAQAKAAGGYDLAILDGPALPLGAPDRRLVDEADAVIAVLSVTLDINDALEEIIAALGPAQRKLAGVILNELSPPPSVARQRGSAYA